MRKQTGIYVTILALIFTGSVAITTIGAAAGDEPRASPSKNPGAEYGSPHEAKAMLTRAIAAVTADKAAAINKFNYNEAQFRDRDLFVFCFDHNDGKYAAHEALVGADAKLMVDVTGRKYGQMMLQNAQQGEITGVDYASPIPGSTKIVAKRAFVTRVAGLVCGVSAYLVEDETRSAQSP